MKTAENTVSETAPFQVLQVGRVDGELQLLVQIVLRAEEACRRCGVLARSHGQRTVTVRDLPAAGCPVRLPWLKRVWRRGAGVGCSPRTRTESSGQIGARMVLTERARLEATVRVGRKAHSVVDVARDYGVGWGTVMRAVIEHGSRLVDDQSRTTPVTSVGVDETAFLARNARHHTRFVPGLVDLVPAGGGPARLIDVVEGRCGGVLAEWIASQPQPWRDGVHVAALDPFRGYPTALSRTLPGAVRVLEGLHACKLAVDTVDQVRRRIRTQ